MCSTHQRNLEIFCEVCKTFICKECLSFHDSSCSNAKYVHVFRHAEIKALPKLDKMLADKLSNEEVKREAEGLQKGILELHPALRLLAQEHSQMTTMLKLLVKDLEGAVGAKRPKSIIEQIRSGIENDKKKLEEAIKNDDDEKLILLTKKIEGQKETMTKGKFEKAAMEKVKEQVKSLSYITGYKEINRILQKLATRSRRLQLTSYMGDWKCDKKYLSSKMKLSENGLEYSLSTSNGYPAMIGDTPIDNGICLFEVVPSGLDCTSKEGFGIIELSKYLEKQKKDPVTPTVYEDMIGFLHSDTVRGMTVVTKTNIKMGGRYLIKVDMNSMTMVLKGEGTHLRATLTPGAVYVPCFSCGCTANKIVIKPLGPESDDPSLV